MGEAMGSHLPLLMSQDAEIAAGSGATEENEACGLVLEKIRVGMVVRDCAFNQTSGACEAAALATDDGKIDSLCSGGIEDIFAGAAIDGAVAVECFKNDPKVPLLDHI